MTDKEEENKEIYDYGCLSYNSNNSECCKCDGYGRNPNKSLEELKKCYITTEMMKEDLDLNKKSVIF